LTKTPKTLYIKRNNYIYEKRKTFCGKPPRPKTAWLSAVKERSSSLTHKRIRGRRSKQAKNRRYNDFLQRKQAKQIVRFHTVTDPYRNEDINTLTREEILGLMKNTGEITIVELNPNPKLKPLKYKESFNWENEQGKKPHVIPVKQKGEVVPRWATVEINVPRKYQF